MVIQSLRVIQGPNVYHSKPVTVMSLDLESWAETGSHELPSFTDKLLKGLPGLKNHSCSPGRPGGFIERLSRGTYLAHIIEHVAIELCNQVGMEISYGKTRYHGETGVYDVVLRCVHEKATAWALRMAVQWVESLLIDRPFDLMAPTQKLRELFRDSSLGPTGQCLLEAAQKRNLPCRLLGDSSLLQLGYGKNRRRLQTAISDRTSLIAADLVQNKAFTKEFLRDSEVPVPEGVEVRTSENLLEATAYLRRPLVVKPVDGHHGEGVTLNVKNNEELFKAFDRARTFGAVVLVEEMCRGRDFRVLLVAGKFAAAAQRSSPLVWGDGRRRIEELVEEFNTDSRRRDGHEGFLTRVVVDSEVVETLRAQGFHLQSVPPKGICVPLRGTANLSGGGMAKDVTESVHPRVRSLCERIARLVDLDICGIDLIADDLSSPVGENLKVIEVNAGPGLRMHLAPTEGKACPVGDLILDQLYPPGVPSRIPIVAVTGTNGKTTTARLIRKIFAENTRVGLTTSDGIFIGDEKVASGDRTGPSSAQLILSDPSVELAVLEVARGGLLRGGLAYDWSDVGVITNVRPDHIGQDGIEDLKDLVWIKSLVAERVRENGTLVLNADDPESLRMMFRPLVRRTRKKNFLYSLNAGNLYLQEHLRAGEDGAWLENGDLYLCRSSQVKRLLAAQDLPFTLGGRAAFQVANTLAAIGAAFALGASVEQILRGLKSFDAILENHGRANLYRVGEGHVILDYGHNPDAIGALGEMVSAFKGYRRTLVFGLPGDRSDEILRLSAQMAGRYFHHLVLRDDHDLRGRRAFEVPSLLAAEIARSSPHVKCEIVGSEREAVDSILGSLQSEDLAIFLYDSSDEIMPLIRQYDPVPVSFLADRESDRKKKVKAVSQEREGDRLW